MKNQFEIIVDTREQKPWFISCKDYIGLKVRNESLKTGDYSIVGHSVSDEHNHTICLERKSMADLFSTVGNGRERFERKLLRMMNFDYAAIVIEGSYSDMFLKKPELSQMNPKSVFRSLLAFSLRYNIHIHAFPSRVFAEKAAYLMLKRFWDDHQPGGKLDFSNL